jgi:hypothetical protein
MNRHQRKVFFPVVAVVILSCLQFRFMIREGGEPISETTKYLDGKSSSSSSSSSSFSRWGVCDPQTVRTTYQPLGTIVLVSFAGWKADRKTNMIKLRDDMIQIFSNDDDDDDHDHDVTTTTITTTTTTPTKMIHKRQPKWNIKTLLYTEDDLPSEYYEEFMWAFPGMTVINHANSTTTDRRRHNDTDRRAAQPSRHYHPRRGGYWTWKPWILWNITSTKVVQEGDVVLWVDSDLRLWIDEPYHFQTAICDIEHRNPTNYGGIFPFVRCRGHPESDYTKPTLFDMMNSNSRSDSYSDENTIRRNNHNADYNVGPTTTAAAAAAATTVLRKDDRTEQIYAGVLGIHIRNDTLSFLQEWKEWGRIPYAFADDKNDHDNTKSPFTDKDSSSLSSSFPLSYPSPSQQEGRRPIVDKFPPTYNGHKNDQSVLSLLVKRYNMKVWPVPYLLLGESGIWTPGSCWDRYVDAGYCAFINKDRSEKTLCRFYNWWLKSMTKG